MQLELKIRGSEKQCMGGTRPCKHVQGCNEKVYATSRILNLLAACVMGMVFFILSGKLFYVLF